MLLPRWDAAQRPGCPEHLPEVFLADEPKLLTLGPPGESFAHLPGLQRPFRLRIRPSLGAVEAIGGDAVEVTSCDAVADHHQ